MKLFAAVVMILFFSVFALVSMSDSKAGIQSSIIISTTEPNPVKIVKHSPVKTGKVSIDVNKICDIESDNNPKAKSVKIVKGKKVVLARGIMQVREAAWNDCIKEMKVNWDYKTYWSDPIKNKAVGSYYMNTEIPSLLKSYKIPDSVETRLATYNYGISNVNKLYNKHPSHWQNHLPKETKNYIIQYNENE